MLISLNAVENYIKKQRRPDFNAVNTYIYLFLLLNCNCVQESTADWSIYKFGNAITAPILFNWTEPSRTSKRSVMNIKYDLLLCCEPGTKAYENHREAYLRLPGFATNV
jgi:hypothetical protein